MGEYVKRSEYISREAAISKIRDEGVLGGDYDAYEREEDVVNTLNPIPAADVVEVVRCRECIYWRGANDLCKGICIDFDADGYCSEGKRKDGGQEDV